MLIKCFNALIHLRFVRQLSQIFSLFNFKILKWQNICLVVDKDGYDIKKQEEVLQESLMMVPDCQRRLVKAFEELKNILDTEQDLKEVGDYIEAKKVLHEAEAELPKEGDILQMC